MESFLPNRQATDLFRWILYPATLLYRLISSSRLLVEFFGSSRYRIMSSPDKVNFHSSFPVWIPLIYFSCLIALTRVSRSMLKRSGDSEHPCLLPDFRGDSCSFSPFKMMLAVSSLYIALIMWDIFLLFQFAALFLTGISVGFCQMLFQHLFL